MADQQARLSYVNIGIAKRQVAVTTQALRVTRSAQHWCGMARESLGTKAGYFGQVKPQEFVDVENSLVLAQQCISKLEAAMSRKRSLEDEQRKELSRPVWAEQKMRRRCALHAQAQAALSLEDAPAAVDDQGAQQNEVMDQ